TFTSHQWSKTPHLQSRKPPQPPVPRRLTRGVTERIDMFGHVVIPMYEHEAEQGVRELLAAGIESLAIVFLHSFTNAEHEEKAAEIARRMMREAGREIPLAVSS